MIAQVTTWEAVPAEDRQWEIDAVKAVPGVIGVYHLVNPMTGGGLGVTFLETGTDVKTLKAALDAAAENVPWNRDTPRPTPVSQTIYQVLLNG
jgi:hypothetical protein